MKKIIMSVVFCLIAGTMVSYAQSQSFAQMKAKAKSELSEKAAKEVRKEAKKKEKEGWKNAPGSLPMVKQLERAMLRESMEDPETGDLMFFKGEATSKGGVYDAAKRAAIEYARNQIAGQVETNMTELVQNSLANDQEGGEVNVSFAKTIAESRSLISQRLGNAQPMVELYRDLPGGQKEVSVTILMNRKQATNNAKAVIREQLKKESEVLAKKLDEKLGW